MSLWASQTIGKLLHACNALPNTGWFMQRWAAKSRTLTLAFVVAYGLLFVIGLGGFFLTPQPRPWTPSFTKTGIEPYGTSAINFALLYNGAQVRVSSWDYFRSHHPLFLLDGQADPTPVEKWVSLRTDKNPWVEIRWPVARNVSSIVVQHAASQEPSLSIPSEYTVQCMRSGHVFRQFHITGNVRKLAKHDVQCQATTGVTLRFNNKTKTQQIRIYEISAWGSDDNKL